MTVLHLMLACDVGSRPVPPAYRRHHNASAASLLATLYGAKFSGAGLGERGTAENPATP
jgi:hypothetical protein